LDPENCSRIKAVAMDMNAASLEQVRAQCPQSEIVNDLKARTVVEGSRWLLLRTFGNFARHQDRVRLEASIRAFSGTWPDAA
jgi:transposase